MPVESGTTVKRHGGAGQCFVCFQTGIEIGKLYRRKVILAGHASNYRILELTVSVNAARSVIKTFGSLHVVLLERGRQESFGACIWGRLPLPEILIPKVNAELAATSGRRSDRFQLEIPDSSRKARRSTSRQFLHRDGYRSRSDLATHLLYVGASEKVVDDRLTARLHHYLRYYAQFKWVNGQTAGLLRKQQVFADDMRIVYFAVELLPLRRITVHIELLGPKTVVGGKFGAFEIQRDPPVQLIGHPDGLSLIYLFPVDYRPYQNVVGASVGRSECPPAPCSPLTAACSVKALTAKGAALYVLPFTVRTASDTLNSPSELHCSTYV